MATATEGPRPAEAARREDRHRPEPATAEPPAPPNLAEQVFGPLWRVMTLRGIIAIAFAVVLLVWPRIGLAAMVSVVGVYAVASGLVCAIGAFALPHAAKRHRFWLGVQAAVGLFGGAAVLLWPTLSAAALLYVLALWAIVVGVIEIATAFVFPLGGVRTALAVASGTALAAVGVLMFVQPRDGAVALLVLVAGFALVRGTSDVAAAVQLRRVAALAPRVPPDPGHVDGS